MFMAYTPIDQTVVQHALDRHKTHDVSLLYTDVFGVFFFFCFKYIPLVLRSVRAETHRYRDGPGPHAGSSDGTAPLEPARSRTV